MRRFLWGFVVLCVAAGVVVVAIARPVEDSRSISHLRVTGRLLVDRTLLARHWEELESDDEFRDVIRAITDDLSSEDYGHLTIELPGIPIHTGRPEQSLDDFEQAVVDRTVRSWKEDRSKQMEYFERVTDDGRKYQYYRPIIARDSCLNACHATAASSDPAVAGIPPFVEGQPMAVIRITLPVRVAE